jgi:hypothetical protein
VRVTFPYPIPEGFNGLKVDFVNAQICKEYFKGKWSKSDPWFQGCERYEKEGHKDGGKGYPVDGKDYGKPGDNGYGWDNGGDHGKGPWCSDYHKVVRGDTLAKIAAKHHSSIRAIAGANHIKNIDLIYTGQKLCIP